MIVIQISYINSTNLDGRVSRISHVLLVYSQDLNILFLLIVLTVLNSNLFMSMFLLT